MNGQLKPHRMLCWSVTQQTFMQDGTRLAAVDLGSNSFRLEIGRFEHGQIHRIEYLKESVRQGQGMDAARNLTPDAMQRGWDCLARFGERLAGFPRLQVRAVATQTLREARNREQFLPRAEVALGFPIDVVSGREEARLIYQGVAHLLPQTPERRLVVDIGGRSTEMILGQAFEAREMESYRVGSATWSSRYFAEGQLTAGCFKAAEIAAQAVLEDALDRYRVEAWDVAYGASGTVGAIGDILLAAGRPAGMIDRAGLNWLLQRLLHARHLDRLRLAGMKEDRRPLIGGGVAVLRALFDLLEIDQLQIAAGALRHGALYDLLDREHLQTDMRATTVQRLASKFNVDATQSRRVSYVAIQLLGQLTSNLPVAQIERLQQKLAWAAELHEVGARISHTDYHKHGAYIINNADAPGFAQSELHRLSQLVLGHRGKLRKLDVAVFDHDFARQLLALRLAVILCHARRDPDLQGLMLSELTGSTDGFALRLRAGWSDARPQSAHLLREEVIAWSKTAWSVQLHP